MNLLTDRLPPHDDTMEQSVLACILLKPEFITKAVNTLIDGPEAFYDMRHRAIYETLLALWKDQKPFDVIMVAQRLKDAGLLDQTGGMNFIGSLPDMVPSAENLPTYIEEVNHKRLARKMVRLCGDFGTRAFEANGNTEALVQELQSKVMEIRSATGCGETTPQEDVDEALQYIEELHAKQGRTDAFDTGLVDLDRIFNGFAPSTVTIIGGYPGSGKTALAMNLAEHVALKHNAAVGVVNLEMNKKRLWLRSICSHARVSGSDVQKGLIQEQDIRSIGHAGAKLRKANIKVKADGPITTDALWALAQSWKLQLNIKLLVVDYLQLVQCSESVDSRQLEVSKVSECIKGISTRLDLPVIALSQLNDDGRLRESRAIGQDADNVWLLEPQTNKDGLDTAAVPVSLRIVKARDGETGTVRLVFLKRFTRFECPTRELPIPSRNNPYND